VFSISRKHSGFRASFLD